MLVCALTFYSHCESVFHLMVDNGPRDGKECPTCVQSSLGRHEDIESKSACDPDITGWSLSARDREIISTDYDISIRIQPLH